MIDAQNYIQEIKPSGNAEKVRAQIRNMAMLQNRVETHADKVTEYAILIITN